MFDWPIPKSGVSHDRALEWRLAARWAGYRWDEFQELEGDMQADVIATYRTAHRIEAVLGHETAHKARAGSRISSALSRLRGRGKR